MSNEPKPLTEAEINAIESHLVVGDRVGVRCDPVRHQTRRLVATIRALQSAAEAREWVDYPESKPEAPGRYLVMVSFTHWRHKPEEGDEQMFLATWTDQKWALMRGEDVEQSDPDGYTTEVFAFCKPAPYAPPVAEEGTQ